MDVVMLLDWALAVMLGLCLGSFATAITYRELNDIPWLWPRKTAGSSSSHMQTYRSACPHCHHTLSALDLVPVLSWLFLRGRCRYCQAKIGLFYPAIELICLAACCLLYWVHGFTPVSVLMMVAVPFLLALVVVDFKYMILPNSAVGGVAVLGAAALVAEYAAGHLSLWAAGAYIAAALIYGGFSLLMGFVVSRVLKKEALGMGDVKFFAVAGLWLGLGAFPAFCILSGVLGIVIGGLWQKITGKPVFPFGPALIAALYALWLIDGSFLMAFHVK